MARFISESVGAYQPVYDAFRKYTNEISQRRLKKLIDLVRAFENEGRLSILVTGYLASGTAQENSSMNGNLIYEGSDTPNVAERFEQLLIQEFPEIAINLDSAYRLDDALEIARFFAQNPDFLEKFETPELAEAQEPYLFDLAWLSAFYAVLLTGGFFIGRDVRAQQSEIETLAERSKILKVKVVKPAQARVAKVKRTFMGHQRRTMIKYLLTELKGSGKTPDEIKTIMNHLHKTVEEFAHPPGSQNS